jgi:hypothetical protein
MVILLRTGRPDLPCTRANVCYVELGVVGGDRWMYYISGAPRPEGVHQVEPVVIASVRRRESAMAIGETNLELSRTSRVKT